MILATSRPQLRCLHRPVLSAAWLIAVCLSWSTANAQETSTATRLEWDVLENREPGVVIGNLKEQFPRCSSFELIVPRSTTGFSVHPETGDVTVRQPGVLNHEKSTVATLYILTKETLVEHQDPYAAQFSASLLEEGVSPDQLKELTHRSQTIRITINVLDAPEAPFVKETKLTVTENAASGTVIGEVEAVDGDQRESLRYNIVGGNVDQMFTIDAATGILRVSEGQQPDFEKAFLFDLAISVSDKDDMVGFGHCFVQVINLDESKKPAAKPTTAEPAFVQTPAAGDAQATGSGQRATDSTSTIPELGNNNGADAIRPSAIAGTGPTAPRPAESSTDRSQPWNDRKIIPEPPTDKAGSSVTIAIAEDPAPRSKGQASKASVSDRTTDVPEPVAGAAGWKPELALSASGHESQSLGMDSADGQGRETQSTAGVAVSPLRPSPSSPTEVAPPESGVRKAAWILMICVVPGLAAAGVVYWRQKKAAALAEETSDAATAATATDVETETAEISSERSESVTIAADLSQEATATEGDATHENKKPQKPVSVMELDDEGPFDPESLLSEEYFEPVRNDDLSPAISYSSGHGPASSGFDDLEESLRRNLSEIRRDLADYQSEFRPQERDTSSIPPFVTAESNRFDGPAVPVPVGILASQSGERTSSDSDLEESPLHAHDVTVMTADPVQTAPSLSESDHLGTTDILDTRAKDGAPSSGASALRSELAELFDLHSRSGMAQSLPLQPKSLDEPSDAESASDDSPHEPKLERAPSPAGTPSQLADEEHRNSVARYLDSLLQKKKPDEILTDRRKSTTPHSGPERRTTDNPKKPAKSFIESYLEQHGGKLPDSSEVVTPNKGIESSADKSRSLPAETESAPAPGPQIPRTPVDVTSIREHMTSFREVATRSVEQALASYQMKQAKGRLALRTMLIIALVFVTGLIYAGNAAGIVKFDALNYLMVLAILLALGELSLQMVTYWKTHREMTSVARGDAERRAEELAEAKTESTASEQE